VFLRYFADRHTRFLIHARSPETSGGGPHSRDPVTAGELKLAVKRILGLE